MLFYRTSLLLQIALFHFCIGSLRDKVSYHELIPQGSSHLRERRSVHHDGKESLAKDFTFRAFNITFHCHLKPRTDFFSPNFKLEVVGPSGISHVHSFQRDSIYVGKCNGDPKSEIRGYFKDGIFSGYVKYKGESYGVENAKRHIHVPDKHGKDKHMIVYRTADMIWDKGPKKDGHGPSFCGNTHTKGSKMNNPNEEIVFDSAYTQKKSKRTKREASTPTWNTCKIIAIGDYKFFREIGNSDVYESALFIAGVMDRVDSIYRQTEFNVEYPITGLGFEIEAMRLYSVPTSGFNKDSGTWLALDLLQSFSQNTTLSEYCAAHLFTHQSFGGNILGLAYIAPWRSGTIGGICSPVANYGGVSMSFNTGWSSTRNQNGETVLYQQSQLVTAHELGHNWGSEHDPENDECAPSTVFGNGKYIMYPYSVSGYDSNNYKFSPCSTRYISKVLSSKGYSCLTAPTSDSNSLCGNGRVDSGEECDAGFIGRYGLDLCCNRQCRLTPGSQCSPVNHECCLSCRLSPQGTQCRGDIGIGCKKSAFCNGASLSCPDSENKDDGENCLDA